MNHEIYSISEVVLEEPGAVQHIKLFGSKAQILSVSKLYNGRPTINVLTTQDDGTVGTQYFIRVLNYNTQFNLENGEKFVDSIKVGLDEWFIFVFIHGDRRSSAYLGRHTP